ncbi:hypothetical protein Vadar_031408 [Vaccinium darrowii]|uniref:Uncharacterized protein n=1 Tax=Vaccinium darrowii TaxID=229202 RepID=A0ACB7XLJ7_9ERIC|nr:hypothetical protein Vadar_031408 [Vaccinium darrowii]
MAISSKTPATIFILLFVAAAATTTTTVAEVENLGQSREQRCRQQELNACQQYLRESTRITRREVLLNQSGWREQFPICCQQLEQLEEQCRCEGLRRVFRQQQQRGELWGLEMQEMMETAESLPSLCRISPLWCDIRSLLLSF